jgi:hypothetical protein
MTVALKKVFIQAVYHSDADELNSDDNDDDDDHVQQMSGRHSVTERVESISVATEFQNVEHSMDIWHKSKKLRAALLEAGKTKSNIKIVKWTDSIMNHFWWCCKICDGEVETLKRKWEGVLHHVCGEHDWIMDSCEHDALEEPCRDRYGNTLEYFSKGDSAHTTLQDVVLNTRWMRSLKYYTKFRHTGSLEMFHSILLMYAPKRIAFQNDAYHTRIILAALDHNHHKDTAQECTQGGTYLHHRRWRKTTKRWDVVPVMEKKSYTYISDIQVLIFNIRTAFQGKLSASGFIAASHPATIQSIIAAVPPPPTDVLLLDKQSRF